jgi:hypothetical protein
MILKSIFFGFSTIIFVPVRSTLANRPWQPSCITKPRSGLPFPCKIFYIYIYFDMSAQRGGGLYIYIYDIQSSLTLTLKNKKPLSVSLSYTMENKSEAKPLWFRALVLVSCIGVCSIGIYAAYSDIMQRKKGTSQQNWTFVYCFGIAFLIFICVFGFLAVVVQWVNLIAQASRNNKVAPLPLPPLPSQDHLQVLPV